MYCLSWKKTFPTTSAFTEAKSGMKVTLVLETENPRITSPTGYKAIAGKIELRVKELISVTSDTDFIEIFTLRLFLSTYVFKALSKTS